MKKNKVYRVLYIEDNPANLRLVKSILGRITKIKVITATEALLGVQLAVEQKPDLILLDINLPRMSGLELVKILKQGKVSDTPVIAISANVMPIDIKKAMAAGFDDYITKPINLKVFLGAVSSALSLDKL